jgi:biotin transport system substrate-specific component
MRTNENGAAPATNLAAKAFAVLLGSVLLIASAKAQIPFWPVPMTLQTLVVVLLGVAMGPRLGVATVVLYLLEGAGGYLAGFIAAAWLAGVAAEKGWTATHGTRGLTIAAGFAVIYALGAAWLSTLVGFSAALKAGILPFLLGDAIKLALGVALIEVIAKARRRFDR